jgi:hypothetical protein
MSSNTNIGNTPVNQGYVQLIHTGETGGIDGTLRTLYDGDGTASDLQIASNKVKISTELYIGSKTIAEYVQDVVGDMFDTNGSHTNITATYDDAGDGAIDLVATGAISGLTEGTGVTITGTANKTIAIGQSVGTSDSVTFSRVNLGSTDTSSFLTGDPKISATGYMMIQGIINETETGSAPAAIVFGNNSTYGNDEISLITNGQNRLFINSSGNITISQDLTISGDLQVNGTTTTVNQTNLDVSDNIIGLNRGVSSNANDSGLIIERGSTGNNVFIGWDESLDRIRFATTTADASSTGNLSLTNANIHAGRLYGDVTGNVTGDLTGDVTGNLTGNVTGDVTGNADTATSLATARSITMSGEVSSGAVNFDGTAGVVIPNTTIGSGVIVDGSIASDANIATSKLASNTISGVALGSNLNALTVGTGMAFASGSNYTGATARQINLNLSAIDHDSLGNYVANEHIDWTIDQGATNIHAGNYTDTNTNQLTTFVIQDGDTNNVTIDQGKYVKFQALTNGGLDIDWASSLGAGSIGDPYDLQFKIDLSNMSALADTLESGDNLLVYNADEGTALAPVSEIQSALSIPSASGTTDGVVTLNANGTLTGESGLTYDTSTLAVTGDQTLSGVLKHSSNGDNRLTLDDDSDSSVANQVTLAGVNNVNILIDGTNNGTGDFQVRSSPTTANDLDTASMILDMDKVTATFNQDTSQQFQIGGANRLKILETGTFIQNSSLGVGITPVDGNARIQATSHIEAGVGSGAIGLTINDGGGNSNVTFNHTERIPEQNGNSGRIEVNTDGVGSPYMAFELAGNVTSGVTVATTEIARINATGLQSSLSGTAASPALRVNDSDTGFYRIADDKLGISTAGTFAVAVDASQRVGIGTSTPADKLHVTGNIRTNGEIYLDAGGDSIAFMGVSDANYRKALYSTNDDHYITNRHTGGDLILMSNNGSAGGETERLRFVAGSGTQNAYFSNVNVGIGTSSPGYKLDVAGAGRFSGHLRLADGQAYMAGGGEDVQLFHSNLYGGFLFNQTNDFYFDQVAADKDWIFRVDDSDGGGDYQEVMRIQGSTKNVGIGTSSPAVDLHILDTGGHSQLRIETDSASHGAYLELESTTNKYQIYNVGGDLGIDEAGVATRLTIKDSTGSVLIGTTNTGWDGDADNLVIGNGSGNNGMTIYAGSSNFSQINFADSNSGAGRYTGVLRYTHSNNSMSFHTNDGVEAVRIDSSQDAHFDQDVIAFSTTPSDIRLKENFEKIENGLDVVSKLEGHTFNWKKGGERLSAGFKAQEVEKVLPHLVDEKKLPLKADDDKEYKILRYEEMIPYLVEAIKEQQEQINKLEEKLNG